MAVITISRQYGSGGDEIATRVCEVLGYRIFDKSLMAEVASEVGLSTEVVDFSEDDHRVRSFLERLLGGRGPRPVARVRIRTESPGGTDAVWIRTLDEQQAVDLVRGAIQAAYDQGNVVVVGRGGQAILRGMPDVLHVRVEAPLNLRVERVVALGEITLGATSRRAQARDLVAQRDEAAADYLKRFYGVDWSEATNYHMVVNAAEWTTDTAAQLIVSAVGHIPALERAS